MRLLLSSVVTVTGLVLVACAGTQGGDALTEGSAPPARDSDDASGKAGVTVPPSAGVAGGTSGATGGPSSPPSSPDAGTTTGPRRTFVTRSAYRGDLVEAARGLGLDLSVAEATAQLPAAMLKAGDYLCNLSADAAGLGRTGWKAYLSTSASTGVVAQRAVDRLTGSGPWVRLDHVVAFATKSSFLVGPAAPLALTERNEAVDPQNDGVWTGTDRGGNAVDWGHSCRYFSLTANGLRIYGSVGQARATDASWQSTGNDDWSCDDSRHLYCFEDE